MTTVLILIAIFAAILLGLNLWTRRLTRQGQATVPQLGEIIPVHGGSIHYVEKGNPENQSIVMIHGLAGQLQHFTYALMDSLADDYHVIAVDRPGCGYSTRDTAELGRLPEQARMIDDFLAAKGVSNAVLVGHSLGGAVSLAMALDHPDRVAGLALLAPLTHKLPGTPAVFKPLEIRTGWLRNLIGNTLAVPIAHKTAPHTLGAVFDPEIPPEDFLDRAGGALGLRPSAFITASQDVLGIDESIEVQAARYPELQVSGGILYGDRDAILPSAEQGGSMTQFGLTHDEIEGLGHMILITEPDACAAFIRSVAQSVEKTAIPSQETGQGSA
ncbi:alpha/beta hydrolase [Rhodobacteraceae bacterium B1Z28]|uniref:Alpha/beta hydrolase n=1 Tax=Ruegeria haliotis TaxID=2747601 RepID=A0ABX2PLB3_9RHOB|nr:alpha/beta hydrolase [Ruegeria haliotis]NVO54261.1 alpha/beta hydrolase [Ruegeria haliotis]